MLLSIPAISLLHRHSLNLLPTANKLRISPFDILIDNLPILLEGKFRVIIHLVNYEFLTNLLFLIVMLLKLREHLVLKDLFNSGALVRVEL